MPVIFSRISMTKPSLSPKVITPPARRTFTCLTAVAAWFIAASSTPAAPGNGIPVTGKDLRAALDAVLAGKATSEFQAPSIGCNIKWKSGNEPRYS